MDKVAPLHRLGRKFNARHTLLDFPNNRIRDITCSSVKVNSVKKLGHWLIVDACDVEKPMANDTIKLPGKPLCVMHIGPYMNE